VTTLDMLGIVFIFFPFGLLLWGTVLFGAIALVREIKRWRR